MLALGIDTAGDMTGIALADETGILAEYQFSHHLNLITRLIPDISRLFEDNGRTQSQLDLISVTVGPGSFTGLRIGITTAKTLAQALGCKIVGLSTLESYAKGVLGSMDGMVCSTLKARKNEYYMGLYRQTGDNWEVLTEDQTFPIADLAVWIKDQKEPILVCGEAVSQLSEIGGFSKSIRFAAPWQNMPRGGVVAYLGIQKTQQGYFDDVMALTPKYTRLSQAEIRLAQGKLTWGKK